MGTFSDVFKRNEIVRKASSLRKAEPVERKNLVQEERITEERKILLAINNKIEMLQNQNSENSKCLKELSEKIGNDLGNLMKAESEKTIEVVDMSEVLTDIDKVYQTSVKTSEDINDNISSMSEDIEALKNSIYSESERTKVKLDEFTEIIAESQRRKLIGVKALIVINIWLSLLSAAVLILNILDII